MKQIHSLLFGFIFILALGCSKPPVIISEQNYPEYQFQVATAQDNYSLEMPEVYDKLYKSKLLNLGGVLDTNTIRDFIDSLVLDSMIGLEANNIVVSDYYDNYRIFKIRYYDFLLKYFFQKTVYEKAEPDSLEVVEFYNNNEDLFTVEEQIDLAHILINKNNLLLSADSSKYLAMSEDELEQEVKKLADSVRSLITSVEKFPEIAFEYSDEANAKQDRGYIGWTKRNTYLPPFDSVAFALRKGDISDPYKDINGWHILLANDYYPPGFQPINEHMFKYAYQTVRTTNSNRIGLSLVDSLLKNFDVIVNPEIADENVFVVNGQTWGAIVNGIDTIDCNEARSLEQSFRDKYNVPNTTAEMKEELFKQLAERYVFLQAARDMGLEKDSVVAEYREQLLHKYAKTIVAKGRVDLTWKADDSLVEEYYNAHLDDFKIQKPLKVQHIIVEDSLFGEFLRDQAMSGVDFLKLAKEHYPGEESIRLELADLGYISEKDVSKEFYETAIKTGIGMVSHPVKTEFGYHVIKVLEIKKNQTLEEAKRTIIPILKKEYQDKYLHDFQDKLFTKFGAKSIGKLHPVHLKPKELRK